MSGVPRNYVEALISALDRRAALFGPDAEMFGDPGWTMLLQLYRANAIIGFSHLGPKSDVMRPDVSWSPGSASALYPT